jgi:hypothetical protein
MGTDMKLLLKHAFPPTNANAGNLNFSDCQSTELLQCFLELLLEFIQEEN